MGREATRGNEFVEVCRGALPMFKPAGSSTGAKGVEGGKREGVELSQDLATTVKEMRWRRVRRGG
jgi:hypothetical protein